MLERIVARFTKKPRPKPRVRLIRLFDAHDGLEPIRERPRLLRLDPPRRIEHR